VVAVASLYIRAMAGKFITFEGGEGAGKSTQIRRLAARLEGAGLKVVTTREPGGTPAAEAVRDLLLSGRAAAMGPEGEAMLFAAARADHVQRVIRPALAAGDWVLSDRFTDSTRVYQGAEGKVPSETLDALERAAVGPTRPDLTVILDLPAEIGLRRVRARQTATGDSPDRFDSDELALHERRREAYLALAARDPIRYVVVDASRSEEEVADEIWRAVSSRFLLVAA
jgi:dTMP kinase